MMIKSELDTFLEFCSAENRICPQPKFWNELYELFPDKRRTDSGWELPLPLILGAWTNSTDLEKMERFHMHVRYATQKNVLPEVMQLIKSLRQQDWHYSENNDD